VKTRNVRAGICAALLMAAAAATAAAEPARGGPGFAPTLTVAGRPLVLNGSGARYKAIFRIYDAALYTSQRVYSVEDLFALEGPKSMQLVARRDLGSDELGRMLVKGINDANRPQDVMRQLVGINQMGEMFATRRQLASGESFGFEYRPGVGTLLQLNGRTVGAPVTEPGFFEVVMRLWLGANPVDARLKADLLGRRPLEAGVASAP
jgi:Chalcone isomerase-like